MPPNSTRLNAIVSWQNEAEEYKAPDAGASLSMSVTLESMTTNEWSVGLGITLPDAIDDLTSSRLSLQ